MAILGSGQYRPKKYKYKTKTIKNPKGWGVWFTQPEGGGKVKVVYYQPKKKATKKIAKKKR